jgi:ABC-type sulfate transport system substrate-binding protein
MPFLKNRIEEFILNQFINDITSNNNVSEIEDIKSKCAKNHRLTYNPHRECFTSNIMLLCKNNNLDLISQNVDLIKQKLTS